MKNLSIDFIKNAVSGVLIQGNENQLIEGVSIDSRTIKNGEMFFAIIGENFDGHKFVEGAIRQGAVAIVVDREIEIEENIPVIKVENTTIALQELAKKYREKLKELLVIGITGSAGKTSTKDMLASIMGVSFKTKKTPGNLNNYYGLPLTILDFDGDEEVAVLEMGMSSLGEIESLAKIAQPQIGIITNVGEAHIESLGSIENVAKAKGELIEALPPDGLAILNFDNKYVKSMSKIFKGERIIYYGLSKEADIYADNIITRKDGTSQFTVHYQGKKNIFKLKRPGHHNIYNALSVIA
ncbi:MAG: UDP-N-acetylmuramoyl-tripeptide--D-alanyl-D-alanine ligase, partial [bacterium]